MGAEIKNANLGDSFFCGIYSCLIITERLTLEEHTTRCINAAASSTLLQAIFNLINLQQAARGVKGECQEGMCEGAISPAALTCVTTSGRTRLESMALIF